MIKKNELVGLHRELMDLQMKATRSNLNYGELNRIDYIIQKLIRKSKPRDVNRSYNQKRLEREMDRE